jgi:hypothetical protein
MSEAVDVWELRKDDVVLGILKVYERNHAWATCHFEPFAAFEEYRHYWYPDDVPPSIPDERFNTWATQIQSLNLVLVNIVDGSTRIPTILHINGDRASFR